MHCRQQHRGWPDHLVVWYALNVITKVVAQLVRERGRLPLSLPCHAGKIQHETARHQQMTALTPTHCSDANSIEPDARHVFWRMKCSACPSQRTHVSQSSLPACRLQQAFCLDQHLACYSHRCTEAASC